jgi:hypothetical protein
MPRISAEYAAGFFDGEGHVCIRAPRDHNPSWALELGISQMDRRPLDLIQERWGGTVAGPRVNAQYEWRANGLKAEQFLRDINPHVIVKAEQIAIALEYRSGFGGSRKALSESEASRRRDCCDRLAASRKRKVVV